MTEHYNRVKKFMELAKQEVPEQPTMPDLQVRKLRAELILEECLETIEALGFDVCYPPDTDTRNIRNRHHLRMNSKEDLVQIIDGCCDISVVTIGTLIACGIPDEPFLEAIDQNNLEKFNPGHSWNKDGKLIKPPGHQPPKIAEILENVRQDS